MNNELLVNLYDFLKMLIAKNEADLKRYNELVENGISKEELELYCIKMKKVVDLFYEIRPCYFEYRDNPTSELENMIISKYGKFLSIFSKENTNSVEEKKTNEKPSFPSLEGNRENEKKFLPSLEENDASEKPSFPELEGKRNATIDDFNKFYSQNNSDEEKDTEPEEFEEKKEKGVVAGVKRLFTKGKETAQDLRQAYKNTRNKKRKSNKLLNLLRR